MHNFDALQDDHDQFLINNTVCISCKLCFTNENVFTASGWREVRISGMCEKCFDECTLAGEEEDRRDE